MDNHPSTIGNPMRPARIAELLKPFLGAPVAGPESNPVSDASHSELAKANEEAAVLSPAQLQSISTYIDILLRWNSRINLSAIRDPDQIVTRHFGESLFAARCLLPLTTRAATFVGTAALSYPAERGPAADGPPTAVADLGSGAGFPGLPIKLWAPRISLTLIESNQKKATFLREVARALTLTDVNIQNKRAEELSSTTFDLVALRAVESFETILPVAASLVGPGGRLALLIGNAQLDTARSTLPQLAWSNPEPIPVSRNRVLVVANRPL
jgi:16S rRNA (guanine527-N7)-methyltransferase